MKKLNFFFLTALTIFFFNLSFALPSTEGNDANLIIKVKEGKTKHSFELRMANLGYETTKVKLKSIKGRIIFKATVKNELGYAKRIHLQDLPSGTYFLEVDRHGSESVVEITMTKSDLMVGTAITSIKGTEDEADQASIE